MYQTNDYQIGLFVLFSVFSIASALFITRQKNVFYASVGLAFLGISVAVLIALLSPSTYAFYSAFHLLLYVGSAVVFLAISLVMFRGLEVKEVQIPWAGVAALVVGALVFISLFITFSTLSSSSPQVTFSLVQFANTFLQKYWFPAVILVIALLTTLIEALSLARGEK